MERNPIKTPAILVIDDDAGQRLFARAVLQAAGWHVDTAEGGAQGAAAVHDGDYTVVLLDLQMPGMDGFATARAIRCHGNGSSSTPILAYSTLDGAETEAAVRAAGMDGRIAKPTDPDALIAAVTPWLHDDGSAARERLGTLFGASELASLLTGLRDQLVEALAHFDEDDLPRRAHRIAGLAGTLGFAGVSEAWSGIAEGDRSGARAARLTARRAISSIDRRLG